MVEGHAVSQSQLHPTLGAHCYDPLDDAGDVFKHGFRRHPQRRNALGSKVVGFCLIPLHHVPGFVGKTIDLDSQSDNGAIKVDDVYPRWMLPPELVPAGSDAQLSP